MNRSRMVRRAGRRLGLAGSLALGSLACRSAGAPVEVPVEAPSEASSEASSEGPGGELAQLCAHSYEILIAPTGAGSPGVRDSFVRSCEANAETRREAMGELAWRARAECMLAAGSADELGRCDGREPAAKEEQPRPSPEVSVAAVCDKVLDILIDEVGPGVIPEAELPEFRKRCMEEFERSYAQDPEEFIRQAGCIMKSKDLSEISLCEGL